MTACRLRCLRRWGDLAFTHPITENEMVWWLESKVSMESPGTVPIMCPKFEVSNVLIRAIPAPRNLGFLGKPRE